MQAVAPHGTQKPRQLQPLEDFVDWKCQDFLGSPAGIRRQQYCHDSLDNNGIAIRFELDGSGILLVGMADQPDIALAPLHPVGLDLVPRIEPWQSLTELDQ